MRYAKPLSYLLGVLLLFLALPSFANHFFENGHFIFSGSAGLSFVNTNLSVFNVTRVETDTLHQTNDLRPFTFAFAVGEKFPLGQNEDNHFFNDLTVGLRVTHFSDTVQGNVFQFGLPKLNNYRFRLPVNSTQFMLYTNLTLTTWHHLSPFVSAGIGAAWNRVGYKDVPVAGVPGGGRTLSKRTNTDVSYAVGGGLQYALTKHISTAIHYLYNELGTSCTSSKGIPAVVNPVCTSLHAHTVLFTIIYSIK